jgi:cholest-4-en-3-one 26-monooxygenase
MDKGEATMADDMSAEIVDLSQAQSFSAGVPHETFDRLRREDPIHWTPTPTGTFSGGFWSLMRHEDVCTVNRDAENFSSIGGIMYPIDAQMLALNKASMMLQDPPGHARLRMLVPKSFSPRAVAQFDGWVREIVVEAIERIQSLETFDYVREVAEVVPSMVIAELMGVDRSDRPRFIKAAEYVFSREASPEHWQRYLATAVEFTDYLLTLRAERLVRPKDDLITELVRAAPEPPLSDTEFKSYLYLLFVAGFETTHTLMAQAMRMMIEDPAIDATVRAYVRAGHTSAVVDEFLRMTSPVMQMCRTATRDQDLKGRKVRKGDMLVMWFTAANRDPEIFPNPHQFDPSRPKNPMLAFGGGAHYCLGNHLARLEMKILLEELVARDVRLRLTDAPQRGCSSSINQLTALPVAHDRSQPAAAARAEPQAATVAHAGGAFRIHVDTAKCDRHAQCQAIAPALFAIDDQDQLAWKAEAEASERLDAERAVAACPMRAISITG